MNLSFSYTCYRACTGNDVNEVPIYGINKAEKESGRLEKEKRE